MKKLLLLGTTLLFFTGCGVSKENESIKDEEAKDLTAEIVIVADDKVVAEEEVVFSDGEVLQEVMKEDFNIEETEEGFIIAIEGIEQSESENKWWIFEANDEQVNVGAGDYLLKNNDTIIWELTQF